MRLLAIESHEWSTRAGLRDKVNVSITADTFARNSPMVRAERAAEGVAVIPITGVMLSAPDAIDMMLGGFANIHGIRMAVESAAADRAVHSVILRINSPGGDVEGLAELGDSIREASRRKKVVAVVQGMGASAAYYVAACTSSIVAGRMDLVGSIGTILVVYDVSKGFTERGIRTIPITTGDYKASGVTGTELTAAQEKYLQSIVDAYFNDFRRTVAGGRRLDPATWGEVSDGRVFLAGEAKRLGLVDELGTFGVTLSRLIAEHATPAEKFRARAQGSLVQCLSSKEDLAASRARRQRSALQLAELRGSR
jgi:signal peptide peptidase SppA